MTPRLKAGIFVRALIRRAEVAGASAMVVRKGARNPARSFSRSAAPTALRCSAGPGAAPARAISSGSNPSATAADDEKVRAIFDRQIKFDPDVWILEIEDRDGRAFVDEPIV